MLFPLESFQTAIYGHIHSIPKIKKQLTSSEKKEHWTKGTSIVKKNSNTYSIKAISSVSQVSFTLRNRNSFIIQNGSQNLVNSEEEE